jgi:hypothetical protein
MNQMSCEDTEMKESPFVYLMNRAKMELMAQDDHMSVHASFSMFNRQTEFPFDPVPNVFKIQPGGTGENSQDA